MGKNKVAKRKNIASKVILLSIFLLNFLLVVQSMPVSLQRSVITSNELRFLIKPCGNPIDIKDVSFSPEEGDLTTVFTFKATYINSNNSKPEEITLILLGEDSFNEGYEMKKIDNNNFSEGRRYACKLSDLNPGNYKFIILAKDVEGYQYIYPNSLNYKDGPRVRVTIDFYFILFILSILSTFSIVLGIYLKKKSNKIKKIGKFTPTYLNAIDVIGTDEKILWKGTSTSPFHSMKFYQVIFKMIYSCVLFFGSVFILYSNLSQITYLISILIIHFYIYVFLFYFLFKKEIHVYRLSKQFPPLYFITNKRLLGLNYFPSHLKSIKKVYDKDIIEIRTQRGYISVDLNKIESFFIDYKKRATHLNLAFYENQIQIELFRNLKSVNNLEAILHDQLNKHVIKGSKTPRHYWKRKRKS